MLTFEEHFRAAAHLANVLVERYGVREGRPGRDRDAELPRVVDRVLGAAAARRDRRAAQRVVDGDELEYGLSDSGAKVAFVDAERLERLDRRAAGARPRGDRRPRARACARGAGVERWEDVLGDVPGDAELPDVELEPEDHATIFYTSGTTGTAEGRARHAPQHLRQTLIALAFASRGAAARSDGPCCPRRRRGAERVPAVGAVLPRDRLPLGARRQRSRRRQARAHAQVGRRARARADRAGAGHDLRRRARDGVAGARSRRRSRRATSRACSRSATAARPRRPSSCGASKQLFPGRTPSNGYGLTETSSVTTMNSGVDYQRKPDSVGVPVPVVRRARRRRRRQRRCRPARSASCGSRARTS